jgi:hypothetical protein
LLFVHTATLDFFPRQPRRHHFRFGPHRQQPMHHPLLLKKQRKKKKEEKKVPGRQK